MNPSTKFAPLTIEISKEASSCQKWILDWKPGPEDPVSDEGYPAIILCWVYMYGLCMNFYKIVPFAMDRFVDLQ